MESDFTGFILAGGKSSRMGEDKFALRIDDETFLSRAVKTLSAVCGSVKIVFNQNQTLESNLPVIRDIHPERGANGGIHAALSNCESEFAIILAVDLPLASREAIANLARFALASPKFSAIVPSQTDGKPQPLCAVYRVEDCLPPLEKLLNESPKASVRDFLELIRPKYIEQNRLNADGDWLFNVNNPSDFQRLTDRLSR